MLQTKQFNHRWSAFLQTAAIACPLMLTTSTALAQDSPAGAAAQNSAVGLEHVTTAARQRCEQSAEVFCGPSTSTEPYANINPWLETRLRMVPVVHAVAQSMGHPLGIGQALRRHLIAQRLPLRAEAQSDDAAGRGLDTQLTERINEALQETEYSDGGPWTGATIDSVIPEFLSEATCRRLDNEARNHSTLPTVAGSGPAALRQLVEYQQAMRSIMSLMSVVELYQYLRERICPQDSLDSYIVSNPAFAVCRPAELRTLRNTILQTQTQRQTQERHAEALRGVHQQLVSTIERMLQIETLPSVGAALSEADRRSLFAACDRANDLILKKMSSLVEDFKTRFLLSLPMIRALEADFLRPQYLENTRQVAAEIKQRVRAFLVERILVRSTLTAEQRAAFVDEFDRMPLNLPTPVPENRFIALRDAAHPVYDPWTDDRFSRRLGEIESYLGDGGLSVFLNPDAWYRARQSSASLVAAEQINVRPSYLYLGGLRPELLFRVLGHELAHKFDPIRVLSHTPALRPVYDRWVACMGRHMSLHERQYGEAFADWVAHQVNVPALTTGGSSSAVQLEALRFYARAICPRNTANELADVEAEILDSTRRPHDPHPDVWHRVNFLFGRHPLVQQVLGCRVPATYCGLDGEEPTQ